MNEIKASWITTKPEEIKQKILELAKKGNTAEKIGLILRDQYGIPKTKLLNIKISKILKEHGLWLNPEIIAIERKIDILTKHFQKNKHDYISQRSLVKRKSALNKIKSM